MSEERPGTGARRRRRLAGAPLRTMALNLALIATIFVTRKGWDPWVLEHELPERLGFLNGAHVSPDRTRAVVRGMDCHVLLDVDSGEVLAGFTGMNGRPAFSPDGRRAVLVQGRGSDPPPAQDPDLVPVRDDEPLVVDALTGRPLFSLKGHDELVYSAAYSPDGRRIVTASADDTARVWDAGTGRELLVLRGHTDNVFDAAFSPDGARIVTASYDGTARIWDARTGGELAVLSGHESQVLRARFSPDGKRVVTWCFVDTTCRIWDAETGAPVAVVRPARVAVVSPDGALIATSNWALRKADVWDARTGAHLSTLTGHKDNVDTPVFSPDGERILTCSTDRSVRMWEARTGRCLLTLPGLGAADVPGAQFTPDGERIVTWRGDDTARVWDAATGELLAAVPGVRRCAVLQDRRLLVYSGKRGFRIVRHLRPRQWWGVFHLPHLWIIAALAVALVVSGWRDLRKLRRAEDG